MLWRVENPRVERFRMAIVDRFVPTIDMSYSPVEYLSRLFTGIQSYSRIYEQNQELRAELQRSKAWKEAAIQLEQENARLRELNNVRLPPRATFVTGEILADSGSPFRQSGIVNIGARDGVVEGAAAMDGLGLVGRISGLAPSSSRVVFVTDSSSRIPGIIRPSGQRTIVAGENTSTPFLDFIEAPDEVKPGDRVVTSGAAGIFPPDLLIGQVEQGPDGRMRLRPAADYRRLRYVRVLRPGLSENIVQPNTVLGPRLPVGGPLADIPIRGR